MKVTEAKLKDVLIIEPSVFEDARGMFFESFNCITWAKSGLPTEFVNDNQSFSVKGVLKGLPFQQGAFAQGKLVRFVTRRVLDVTVDIRPDSPTFGKCEFFELDGKSNKMVYIPEDFAHGFLTSKIAYSLVNAQRASIKHQKIE